MVSCRELRRNKGNIIGSFGAEAVCRGYVNVSFRCKDEMDSVAFGFENVRYRNFTLHFGAGACRRVGTCGLWAAPTETLQRGYVLPEGGLEQVPVGATQEQVLIVLGTPSTVATVNGEAFYYISQKAQRSAPSCRMKSSTSASSPFISTKNAVLAVSPITA